MKIFGIIVAGLLLVALTGAVFADRNVPATPEIQGITTSTSIQAQGTVTETDSLAWTTASNDSTQQAIGTGAPLADYRVTVHDRIQLGIFWCIRSAVLCKVDGNRHWQPDR